MKITTNLNPIIALIFIGAGTYLLWGVGGMLIGVGIVILVSNKV